MATRGARRGLGARHGQGPAHRRVAPASVNGDGRIHPSPRPPRAREGHRAVARRPRPRQDGDLRGLQGAVAWAPPHHGVLPRLAAPVAVVPAPW